MLSLLRASIPVLLAAAFLLRPDQRLAAQQRPLPVLAPPAEGKVQRLTLVDGSELLGRIVAVEGSVVRFESALGVTAIPRESIVAVREESPGRTRDGEYYFPHPNPTRLIFAPTGRMLAVGEGYFSDYWIFFPGLAFGVSDYITLGGGVSIIPGSDQQLFYFTPKVGLKQGPTTNFSLGALVIGVPSSMGPEMTGVLYGVGTWGSPDASVTAGMGYGFVQDELADHPAIMLGGEVRAAPRLSLVTENYLLPGGNVIVSGGLRFMGRDLSVDLAAARLADGYDSFWLPLVSFNWKWGP